MRISPWSLLFLLACNKADGPPPPAPAPSPAAAPQPAGPDWKAAIHHEVEYDAATSQLRVKVEIQPGFHAYTTGETVGKPLALELDEAGAYALEGPVQYPAGETKDLPVGKSVIVEGKAEIQAKVKAKAEAGPELKGTFRYQVCTAEACDRPRSAPFALAATPK